MLSIYQPRPVVESPSYVLRHYGLPGQWGPCLTRSMAAIHRSIGDLEARWTPLAADVPVLRLLSDLLLAHAASDETRSPGRLCM